MRRIVVLLVRLSAVVAWSAPAVVSDPVALTVTGHVRDAFWRLEPGA